MESGQVEVPVEVPVDEQAQLPPIGMDVPLPAISTPATSLPKAAKTPLTPSTPSDIASSKWRTLRCPMAPCPRKSGHDESGLSSPCSGLITPNNVWNWSDTPGLQTPQPLEASTQSGVSPAALSLAIASAKLGATLPHQTGPSVSRVRAGNFKRASTHEALEVCVETGLTVDSLPDLAHDVADDSVSEASLSPRSIGSDGSDGQD